MGPVCVVHSPEHLCLSQAIGRCASKIEINGNAVDDVIMGRFLDLFVESVRLDILASDECLSDRDIGSL